jgi:aryl-phospho-beta-D-glucosidase BglC (GH1 family)
MNKTTKLILTVLLSVCIFLQSFAQNLKVSGTKIVNSNTNTEVILDAVNLGNWMVMEGYIMQSGGAASYQHDFKAKLVDLIGQSRTNQFYDAWLNNYVTYDDIWAIKNWGFNAVRIPIHYEYFTSLNQDVWYNQGFDQLSRVLGYCAWAGIYAIIDLHAAPGGQGRGDICDYDDTKPSLWESDANKNKTIALWKEISRRYKNREWIAGYDLINEPHWALGDNSALKNLYVNITNEIRWNGDNHIVFVEGNWYANDFNGLTPAWDANMVYSFHKYWSYNDQNTINSFLALRDGQKRPLWCGETGENSNSHYTMTMELFKQHSISSSWWPMKKWKVLPDLQVQNFQRVIKPLLIIGTTVEPDPMLMEPLIQ